MDECCRVEQLKGARGADDRVELALRHGRLAHPGDRPPPPVAELGPEPFTTAEKSPRVVQQSGDIGTDGRDNRGAVIEESVETGLNQIDEPHTFRHHARLMAVQRASSPVGPRLHWGVTA
ncbi:hypothetical protein GCM10022287_15760 [Gryllotalpicola koreensis]|uniref:Uncharacterized protein n=1 Tax=Gryllotalpicola koreensis TaxID=993086 RepID=A0ABP7ZYB7_9MICO